MQGHMHSSIGAQVINTSPSDQQNNTSLSDNNNSTNDGSKNGKSKGNSNEDTSLTPSSLNNTGSRQQQHLSQKHLSQKNFSQRQSSMSFFEFWPTWLVYLPVVLQWPFLALRYRSLTLPLLANPSLTIAAMVGVAKSELMNQTTGACREAFLDWQCFSVSEAVAAEQAATWIKTCAANGIELPFVCKPDIGCRGSGVKLIHNEQQLAHVIASYPVGTALLAQTLASYEPEAGVFYVRMPEQKGYVASLAIKESPYVIGDGTHTLAELIADDDRAGQLQHLYYQRHKALWDKVVKKGEVVRLVFSASHCRGAVFSDARIHITPELTLRINQIMDGLPNFHYGRLDIKYADLDSLKQGKSIEIIEINGASAESIHIWDKDASLFDAITTLMWQYRTLYKIGDYYRGAGRKPPGLRKLLKHYFIEKRLQKYYPTTD